MFPNLGTPHDGLIRERLQQELRLTTRREFLRNVGLCFGGLAMGAMAPELAASVPGVRVDSAPLGAMGPHFAPKAKRVIYLHMVGSPSQLELFDYKPELAKVNGKPCPQSFLEGKRFAFIKGVPNMLGPQFAFKQYGQSGAWVSDRLPHFSQVVDEVCMLHAMRTPQFNHGPAQLMIHTGKAIPGNPSLGSWSVYGLGTENQNLPGFVVLLSGGHAVDAGKPVWGSGFLPSVYQGVQCRSKGDPILYMSNPDGVTKDVRRAELDALDEINRRTETAFGDRETASRVAQYELAFRMQMSAPEAFDLSQEPAHIHELYGTSPGKESLANNCLLARRLAERGVRFIQLYDYGWDAHGAAKNEAINEGFIDKCVQMDRPVTALLMDLKQRGMLDDTLVIWGGEFGRTPMQENRSGQTNAFVGRDHHPFAFTMWMAGGGVKKSMHFGETDEMGYNAVKDQVHVHDLHATILHLLGYDHTKLTYRFQGRDFRLTDVFGNVVSPILA